MSFEQTMNTVDSVEFQCRGHHSKSIVIHIHYDFWEKIHEAATNGNWALVHKPRSIIETNTINGYPVVRTDVGVTSDNPIKIFKELSLQAWS